ncbi:MAG: TetR family transcriptional regulator [Alphaproteobacteria bacterium]|jgi:AcrR family transcriptional regulator|nr:TetR family transcriptional regulator [Alphaproteobacteria bacterium]MDP7223490.1 TetR family transcriptional regulator [Alphaproteobacteria bacterium]
MRRTKEEAQQTRNDILDAAVALFSENGVSNTSLQDIAKQANVTRGAIYWHFKNKAEIFDALHVRLFQPLAEMILEDCEKDHPHPIEQLETLCVNLLLELTNNLQKRQAARVFMIKCNYSGDQAVYKDEHEQRKTKSFELFKRYFERAHDQGIIIDDTDPEILTLSLDCYLKGIVTLYLDDPDKMDLETYARPLIHQFFKQFPRSQTGQ